MKVDFDQIKKTTDLVRVIQSHGVKLKKQGKDYVGLCPFHKEKTPSFHVTPSKGLFHCFGCNASGNVIQFVAKKEGISEHDAGVKLLGSIPGVTPASSLPQPPAAAKVLNPAEAAALLLRVVHFYVRTLHKDRAGFEYLKRRNLIDGTMLETFQIGYCNGTLHKALPKSGDLIEELKALGLLTSQGQEHFRGCVTVPIFDQAGNVCGVYGRRINDEQPHHLYLPGEHRGVWNGTTAKTSQTLLLAEAILDGLSLWQAGFKNVIAIYGCNGWKPDHEALLRENNTREVFLCLDNDKTGCETTDKLRTEILPPLVKSVHAVTWPEGVKDANDFFLSRTSAEFEALLKSANPTAAPPSQATAQAVAECIEMTPDGFTAKYESRSYELCAIEHPSKARLRATVKAVSADSANAGRFHIDTVDFYLSRSRRTFISEAARLFRDTAEVIEADVNRLIVQLESYVQKRRTEHAPQINLVSEPDKAEALKLGRHPDLVGEILRDLEKLGAVGETLNKVAGYLAMTSRKLPDPLSLLILSGSGAGKSHLQDAILSLCPDEDLIKLTSLSDRALFYKGEDSLKHKVLAVEEVAGALGADYALRNLISAKKLVNEVTIKNPLTGKLETQVNTVYGPTAVFQTTTNPNTDAETKSRFIITSIDESLAQTKAILEAQRNSHTLEGIRRKKQREAIIKRHHAFQRLLKPVAVVNPLEPLLSYTEDRLLVRRDNPKYLHLILAVTFLYQLQRPVKHDADAGDYIETTLDDIAIANELATELFGQSLDELNRPSRELLKLIRRMVEAMERKQGDTAAQKASADSAGFSRRDVREFTGWSDYQIKIHIKQLEDLEYLIPLSGRRGQCFSYRLAWEGEGLEGERFLLGLISVEELRQQAKVVGLSNEQGGSKTEQGGLKSEVVGLKMNLEGSSRVQVGLNGNGANQHEHRAKSTLVQKLEGFTGELVPVLQAKPINGALRCDNSGGHL
jgi:DNA primase